MSTPISIQRYKQHRSTKIDSQQRRRQHPILPVQLFQIRFRSGSAPVPIQSGSNQDFTSSATPKDQLTNQNTARAPSKSHHRQNDNTETSDDINNQEQSRQTVIATTTTKIKTERENSKQQNCSSIHTVPDTRNPFMLKKESTNERTNEQTNGDGRNRCRLSRQQHSFELAQSHTSD